MIPFHFEYRFNVSHYVPNTTGPKRYQNGSGTTRHTGNAEQVELTNKTLNIKAAYGSTSIVISIQFRHVSIEMY
ncbi:hypothetical protein H5410_014328 [Solanum commersonii]|uniref:Uncharacterized protein n=1 Tax=Solanum commersonii TaxID=4109 RepID=A0A9J5ZQP8_SOLCO|nr:hypothetical protein H5410_014328 [Solanum commersonii]